MNQFAYFTQEEQYYLLSKRTKDYYCSQCYKRVAHISKRWIKRTVFHLQGHWINYKRCKHCGLDYKKWTMAVIDPSDVNQLPNLSRLPFLKELVKLVLEEEIQYCGMLNESEDFSTDQRDATTQTVDPTVGITLPLKNNTNDNFTNDEEIVRDVDTEDLIDQNTLKQMYNEALQLLTPSEFDEIMVDSIF